MGNSNIEKEFKPFREIDIVDYHPYWLINSLSDYLPDDLSKIVMEFAYDNQLVVLQPDFRGKSTLITLYISPELILPFSSKKLAIIAEGFDRWPLLGFFNVHQNFIGYWLDQGLTHRKLYFTYDNLSVSYCEKLQPYIPFAKEQMRNYILVNFNCQLAPGCWLD